MLELSLLFVLLLFLIMLYCLFKLKSKRQIFIAWVAICFVPLCVFAYFSDKNLPKDEYSSLFWWYIDIMIGNFVFSLLIFGYALVAKWILQTLKQ